MPEGHIAEIAELRMYFYLLTLENRQCSQYLFIDTGMYCHSISLGKYCDNTSLRVAAHPVGGQSSDPHLCNEKNHQVKYDGQYIDIQ